MRRASLLLLVGVAFGLCACPQPGLLRADSPGGVYDLVLPRVGGGEFSLEQCRGKVMMLDFFATWSQASMVAIPSYGLLYRKFRDQGLCLVGIGLDDLGQQILDPFVRGMQMEYPVLEADEGMRAGKSVFGALSAIPMLMIFDRRGEPAQVFVGLVHPGRVEAVLQRLLP